MLAARRFLLSGRVQGVGFRYFAQEAAQAEGLSGSVRNLPDGRVEIEAEGDAEALGRFARRIARGPSLARVDAFEEQDAAPSGRGGAFRIR